jgi:hypothetical protein
MCLNRSRVLSGDYSKPASGKNVDDRKNSCLESLSHDKPVNSAYFNPLNGTRLLTTDQVNPSMDRSSKSDLHFGLIK